MGLFQLRLTDPKRAWYNLLGKISQSIDLRVKLKMFPYYCIYCLPPKQTQDLIS